MFSRFSDLLEKKIKELNLHGEPVRLYEPIRYMMAIGGKRMRPCLLLLSNEMFGGNENDVLDAALAIEVFHNFTLLHDDIMDKAPLRRSMETVHRKWDSNIAILSGDAMFVQSCQLLMNVPDKFLRDVLNMFHQTAIEVCEGQQFDMDFETQQHVSIDDYLSMITLKTAVLLGCSAYIGAICAGASKEESEKIYDFAKNMGIAFQLHDDILDVYGNPEKFGKQAGGDILSNKKTILLLLAKEKAAGQIKTSLDHWLSAINTEGKVEAVTSIYQQLNIREEAEEKMEYYFSKAMLGLDSIQVAEKKKENLRALIEKLMVREN